MLRIETFAPARRATAPSTSSLRRGITRKDLEFSHTVEEELG